MIGFLIIKFKLDFKRLTSTVLGLLMGNSHNGTGRVILLVLLKPHHCGMKLDSVDTLQLTLELGKPFCGEGSLIKIY